MPPSPLAFHGAFSILHYYYRHYHTSEYIASSRHFLRFSSFLFSLPWFSPYCFHWDAVMPSILPCLCTCWFQVAMISLLDMQHDAMRRAGAAALKDIVEIISPCASQIAPCAAMLRWQLSRAIFSARARRDFLLCAISLRLCCVFRHRLHTMALRHQ